MAGFKTVWKDEFLFDAFESARAGLTDAQIAEMFNVRPLTILSWKKKKPLFKMALERARKSKKDGNNIAHFHEYVFNRLDADLKDLWHKIVDYEDERNGLQKAQKLMNKQGKRVQQHLFLYAVVASNFNVSRACSKIGLTTSQFKVWCKEDPDFFRLLTEMQEHKRDFYEDCLMKKVKEGDGAAIIFANRTFNRNRGYGDKQEIEINQKISHEVKFSIEDLDLSPKVLKKVLAAIKKLKDKNNDTDTQPTVVQGRLAN